VGSGKASPTAIDGPFETAAFQRETLGNGVLVLSQFTAPVRRSPARSRLSPEEQRDRMRAMRALVSEFNVYRSGGPHARPRREAVAASGSPAASRRQSAVRRERLPAVTAPQSLSARAALGRPPSQSALSPFLPG
jgi:hypothetical protein